MTAPTIDAPASGEGGTEGQAPEDNGTTSTARGTGGAPREGDPAGPGERGGDTRDTRARRVPGEKVRSASRDDDAPREGDAGDEPGDDDRGKGREARDWRVEDLPPGAQKLIADLRKESSTRRTEASEAKKLREAAEAKATEGDERFAKATHAFMTALGLTPEPDEPERSPEELLGEVTQKYQHTRVELAVYRAAAANEADPDALLDSRAFLTKALALDPGADEFDQAIAAAIAEAVDGNPKLRSEPVYQPAQQAPSGGDFGGGSAEPLGPDEWSVDDFRRARRDSRGN